MSFEMRNGPDWQEASIGRKWQKLLLRSGVLLADSQPLDGAEAAGLRAPAQRQGLYLTDSFSKNRCQLQRLGQAADAPALNRIAAHAARARIGAGLLAGGLGPLGEILAPIGTMPEAQAIEIYSEQAAALRDGGVDLLWFEGLTSPSEVSIAERVAQQNRIPWCVTGRFDTAGSSVMGMSPADFARAIDALTYKPLAAGADLSGRPSDLLRAILALSASGPRLPLISALRPSEEGPPFPAELMESYAAMARDCGARVILCPAGSALPRLRRHLRQTSQSARPRLNHIVARFGRLSTG